MNEDNSNNLDITQINPERIVSPIEDDSEEGLYIYASSTPPRSNLATTESHEDSSTEDVTAENVTAEDVTAEDVPAEDVTAEDVTAEDVPAEDVTAEDVTAEDTSDSSEDAPAQDIADGTQDAPTENADIGIENTQTTDIPDTTDTTPGIEACSEGERAKEAREVYTETESVSEAEESGEGSSDSDLTLCAADNSPAPIDAVQTSDCEIPVPSIGRTYSEDEGDEVPVAPDFGSEIAAVEEESALSREITADSTPTAPEAPSDANSDDYLSEYLVPNKNSDGNGSWYIEELASEDTEAFGDEAPAAAVPLPDNDDDAYIGTEALQSPPPQAETASGTDSIASDEIPDGIPILGDMPQEVEDGSRTLTNGITAGDVISGGFTVIEKMEVVAGEADLYLCENSGVKYVLKHYKRADAINPTVKRIIASIDSPYIASPVAEGTIGELPYEIIPYYKNGSIKGKKYSLEELRTFVVPALNEALRILHENRIIHMDIKPSNIMLCDDERSFALIDFGISTAFSREDGNVTSNIGFTRIYGAPEVKFSSTACKDSDYYSLGITVYELFTGELPLASKPDAERDSYIRDNGLPIPDYLPDELSDLISGLTYNDISTEEGADTRWTYKQVAAWCGGEVQPIPGKVTADSEKPDYPIDEYFFMSMSYKSAKILASDFTKSPTSWDEAKRELAEGRLYAHFVSCNKALARLCRTALAKAASTDTALWSLIYGISDQRSIGFAWKGRTFSSAEKMGTELLCELHSKKTGNLAYWGSILEERLLTAYFACAPKDSFSKALKNCAATAEEMWKTASEQEKTRCLYTAAFLLCNNATLVIDEKLKFSSLSELSAHMQNLYNNSVEELRAFLDLIINDDMSLNPQFEAWLAFYGYDNAVSKWKKER